MCPYRPRAFPTSLAHGDVFVFGPFPPHAENCGWKANFTHHQDISYYYQLVRSVGILDGPIQYIGVVLYGRTISV